MIGPTSRLTFGGDPVPDIDTDHCSISHTVAAYDSLGDLLAFLIGSPAALFYNILCNDWRRQGKLSMNPLLFGSDPAGTGSGYA